MAKMGWFMDLVNEMNHACEIRRMFAQGCAGGCKLGADLSLEGRTWLKKPMILPPIPSEGWAALSNPATPFEKTLAFLTFLRIRDGVRDLQPNFIFKWEFFV